MKTSPTKRAYLRRWRAIRKKKGFCSGCRLRRPRRGTVCSRCRKREKQRQAAKSAVRRCVCGRHPGRYAKRCGECRRISWRERTKRLVMEHYGGVRCACCKTDLLDFLTIDHIEEDGARHRRGIRGAGCGGGVHFYRWLIRNGYPKGFQVLCFNCNVSKHLNGGKCAHARHHSP